MVFYHNFFIVFKEFIRKQSELFGISFTNCLVDFPPCLIIFFISNIFVYLECPNILRYSVAAFIISCNRNWLLRAVNGILDVFDWKIFRMDTCFLIKIIMIYTYFFSCVLSISRFFSFLIALNLFSWKIFRMRFSFFINIIRFHMYLLHYVSNINQFFSLIIDL